MIISKAKGLRKEHGYKTIDVGKVMDCSDSMIYEIENHIDHVKLYHLEAYAKAIGCKVKDLFEECE